jgi:hypothetical protein
MEECLMAAWTVLEHDVASGGAEAYWETTAISQSHAHLLIVMFGRISSAGAGRYPYLQMGDGSLDTGSNYGATTMYARTASSGTNGIQTGLESGTKIPLYYMTDDNEEDDVFGCTEIWIPNYANTSYEKSVLAQSSAPDELAGDYEWCAGMFAGLWKSTNNVERVRITPSMGSFMQYSTYTLYGIGAA